MVSAAAGASLVVLVVAAVVARVGPWSVALASPPSPRTRAACLAGIAAVAAAVVLRAMVATRRRRVVLRYGRDGSLAMPADARLRDVVAHASFRRRHRRRRAVDRRR